MKYRKLRIVWSVAWGIVAVLLIALWVRSYWHIDQFGKALSSSRYIGCQTIQGQFMFCYMNDRKFMAELEQGGFTGWSHGDVLMKDWIDDSPNAQNHSVAALLFPGFNFAKGDFRMPHWLFVFAAATLSISSWPYWSSRFNLRTLLIATTLVAIGLGLIVWLR